MFGELKLEFDGQLKGIELPEGTASAKISKGENYEGLPWVMLDHPRYFQKEEVFAIRSFFWWGNFFSITLHLSGQPLKKAAPVLLEKFDELRKTGFLVCVNQDPWRHDMGNENYRRIRKMKEKEFRKLIMTKEFVKIAACVPLKKWEKAGKELNKLFAKLIRGMSE